jgi:two-component system NtrC family sensor kinase
MTPDPTNRTPAAPGNLEREESQLWRWVLLFMVLLAAALTALLWERLEVIPYSLRAIPFGVFALVVLFAVYAYGRRREVTELKGLLRGLQEHVGAAPSEEQLDQLSQVIMRSQRNFKELIDSFDDPACAVSLDGTLRTVNKRITELTDTSYSELIGRKIYDFVEEPTREEIERSIGRFLDKKRWAGTVRIRLKNNSRPLYFDCVLNAILKGDEVVGASMLGRDVTEQREKEMRFTELFETLQEGVYFSTPDGQLLDANPALVSMLGYSERNELLRVDPKGLNVDPGQQPVLGRAVDDRGGVRTREIKLRRKDGTAAVFLDSSRAVWDTSGNIIRYQGTLVDITEKRKMERQLALQEEFRRRLLESFPDLILVVDRDERYTFVSSRSRDLLGRAPEDMLGKKISDMEDHSPELAALYHSVVSGQEAFSAAEYGAKHRDGSWRTMRASASQLVDAEGKITGVIISVRDITIERKLEQQVVQGERLAAMGAMIGGVAHELNNPLTSILGVSELLQDTETNETARKQLGMLQQQARRAAEIVQNLTYFSRPPAPGKSKINLVEIVERTLNLHAYSLRKNNITVDFLKQSVPYALGDPHQLMQVFLNLILNAEQAIREVRQKGTLRIRLGRTDNSVWVSFLDDGPGIPKESLPSIFDPFYTTKRPGRGTGLGLSICKSVMKEHNGSVEAANAPDGGAVFTVTLPVAG